MRWTLLVLILAAACGPKVTTDPSPYEEDDPAAGAPVENAQPTWEELPVAEVGPGAREGTIERAKLDAILDAGPGAVLRHFEVAAEHVGNRFLGWRLVAVDPKHRGFDGVDLLPGDVLVALNGRSVSRPDELQAVWDSLRTADAIIADLRRGEARFSLRWAIVTPEAAP
jgi:hypothetical protein